MESNISSPPASETLRPPTWPWKIGIVLDTQELLAGVEEAIAESGARRVFEFRTGTPTLEIARALEREKPEVLFVEFSRTAKAASEWIGEVRRGEATPLVVAVHTVAEPAEMISALRAGASEFICLPVKPAIYEAMNRIGSLLESMRTAGAERGRIVGILSAKGGCGATSIACYLSAALEIVKYDRKILVADLDWQAPSTHDVFRVRPKTHVRQAFESVRGLNSNSWREFISPISPSIDLLGAPRGETLSADGVSVPEHWRAESLFTFIRTLYGSVFADLGRHLNPSNWMFLQNIDELYLVTAPDVLALYQTRSILQTLSGRGFDKSRVKMILNRNLASPQDFWVESIEQMFEMPVFAAVPHDATLDRRRKETFEFPSDTQFGRTLIKLAAKLAGSAGPETRGFRLRKKAA